MGARMCVVAPLRVAAKIADSLPVEATVNLNDPSIVIYRTIGVSGCTTRANVARADKTRVGVIVTERGISAGAVSDAHVDASHVAPVPSGASGLRSINPEIIQSAARLEIGRIVYESQLYDSNALDDTVNRLAYAGVTSPAALVNLLVYAINRHLTPLTLSRRVILTEGSTNQFELNIETKIPTVYESYAQTSVQGLVLAAYATEIGNALSIYPPARAVVDDTFYRASETRGLMTSATMMNTSTISVMFAMVLIGLLLYHSRDTHFRSVFADALVEAHKHIPHKSIVYMSSPPQLVRKLT